MGWNRVYYKQININKKEKKDINCLKVDDQEATDPFVISNYFSEFFTTIAKKIEIEIVQTDRKYSDFLDILSNTNRTNEVQSLIKILNLKKATGPSTKKVKKATKRLKLFDITISVPLAKDSSTLDFTHF